MSRVIAALNKPRRILDILTYAKFIANNLASDPVFVAPRPALATFTAQIEALELAEVASNLGGTADTAKRNACLLQVEWSLETLRVYVQNLAADYPREEAAAIIARSGMDVKRVAGPKKPRFVVKYGRTSGTVHLYARAPKARAVHQWQYSLDGSTWIDAGSTTRADLELSGFSPGTRCFFRHRVVVKGVVYDWSDAFELIVD
jgi:hypothetical protein